MGKIIIGIIAGIAVVVLVLAFTNVYDVLKPEIDSSVSSTKEAISQVDGRDVVEKTEELTDKIKNVASEIKLNSP